MAFSTTGVQTGTDTDLTGLTSITGVTSATDGNVTTYTFPSTVTNPLRIQGTLSHNTELERIIFQRPINAEGNSPLIWIDGGTYNYGIEKVPGVFTDGVGIQINGGGTVWYNGGFNSGSTSTNGTMIAIGTSGTDPDVDVSTLNINGGRISGQFHLTVRPNGVINNIYNGKFLVDASTQTAGQEWLSRFYGGTFGTADFAYEGGSISLGNGSHGRTLTFDRSNAGVAYWPQHANGTTFAANDADTYPTVRNVTFSGNAVDIAPWQSTTTNVGAVRVQNCGNGSNININGGETTGNNANNAGYVWITRQIDTNFLSLADQSNVVATIRMFDTDRQSNLATPITDLATGSISYVGKSTGSLTSWIASGTGDGVTSINTEADNEVALAFWSLDRDGNNHVRGTIDNGDWAMDRRSEGGVIGVDDFVFYTYAYGFNPVVTNADLAGEGILTLSENFITDANITEASEATALAYTGIATTNQSVVVSASRTLDQLYDKAMADKVNNDALSTNDTVVADWLFSATNGNVLRLDGTKTIAVGSNVLSSGTTHQTIVSPTGIQIDGTGFNGITYNGTTRGPLADTAGDFGAITNGSDITTTTGIGTHAATSIDSSMLSSTTTVSMTGNATSSTVTSSAGDVTIGGNAETCVLNGVNTTVTGNSLGNDLDGAAISIGGTSTIDDIDATTTVNVDGNVSGTDIDATGAVTLGANITNLSTVDTNGNITIEGNSDNVTLDGAEIRTKGTSNGVTYTSSSHTFIIGLSTEDEITSGARIQLDGGSVDTEGTSTGHFDVNAGTHTRLTATTLGSSDLRANGALVNLVDCVFTSNDLINIDNTTISGGSLTSPLIDAARNATTQTITDVAITSNQVRDLVQGRFASDIVFSTQTGTVLRLDYTAANAATDLNGLLGTGWELSPGDTLDLRNSGSVSTVTITVDEQALLSGVSGLSAGDTSGNINGFIYTIIAEAIVSYDVTIGGTLDEIKARGGRFAIWDETNTSPILAPHTITSSTTLSDITASKQSDNQAIWRVYYKPETSWGTGRTAYGMTLNADGTILSVGQISAPVSVGVNVHVSAITDGSETEPPTSLGTYSFTGSGSTYAAIAAVDTAQNQPSDDALNGGGTQALCLEFANTESYFLSHYNRVLAREMFSPGANNGSDWRDLTDPVNPVTRTDGAFMFTSGDQDATPPRQQIISQISGLVTQNPNGYNQVIGVTEGNATIATVQGAVAGAVATGVDTALTNAGAATRQDLANGFNTGQVFENGAPVGVDTNA